MNAMLHLTSMMNELRHKGWHVSLHRIPLHPFLVHLRHEEHGEIRVYADEIIQTMKMAVDKVLNKDYGDAT